MSIETNLNESPFFDDFDETKNFHRVLFRPGYAVQARELTQIQTILQNQIERFASAVYVEGTVINGCDTTAETWKYVKLRDKDANNRTLILTDFFSGGVIANSTITGETTGVTAKLLDVADGSESATPNFLTAFVSYTNSGANNTTKTFANNETLIFRNSSSSSFIVAANTITQAQGGACGEGVGANVQEGIVYHKGHFIRVDQQSKAVIKYSTTANTRIGLETNEVIIDSNQDSSLLDNASGATNFSAPGASRLKLSPTIASRPLSDTGTANTVGFIPLLDMQDGFVIRDYMDTRYSGLGDELAKRTYEESGNYALEPFKISTEEHLRTDFNNGVYRSTENGDANKLVVEIDPSVGYVGGYRIENTDKVRRTIDKATTFDTRSAVTIGQAFGQYVICNNVVGTWNHKGLVEVDLYDTAQTRIARRKFSSGNDARLGNKIGTAKLRGFQWHSGTSGDQSAQFRIYGFDAKMNAGKSFEGDVKALYISTGGNDDAYADIVLENGEAKVHDPSLNKMIFPVQSIGTKTLKDEDNTVQTQYVVRHFTDVTFAADGTATVNAPTSEATGGSNKMNDTGSPLSSVDERNIIIIPKADATINLFQTHGTATKSSSSNTFAITGKSTFVGKVAVGDYVQAASGLTEPMRVTEISANVITVHSSGTPSTGTISDSTALTKVFKAGSIIDTQQIGSFTSTATQHAIDLDISGSFTGTFAARVYYDMLRDSAVQENKDLNKTKYIHIDTSAQPSGTNPAAANYPTNSSGNTGPWSLGVSDAFKLEKVYMGAEGSEVTTSSTDVTTHFELDNGQRESFYDGSRLIKRSDSSLTVAGNDLLVQFSWFKRNRSAGIGYMSVDSYPIDDSDPTAAGKMATAEIPVFTSFDGIDFDLRDSIDFRPAKANTCEPKSTGTSTAAPTNPTQPSAFDVDGSLGSYVPTPDENFQCDVQFYLPRIDTVTLRPNGDFDVLTGTPSENPAVPTEDDEVSMTLGAVVIPPYPSLSQTAAIHYDRFDYQVNHIGENNRRYTMEDIRELDADLESTKIQVELNRVEIEALKTTLLREDDPVAAPEPPKEVVISNPPPIQTYINSMQSSDFVDDNQTIRPIATLDDVDLIIDDSQSVNLHKSDDSTRITLGNTAKSLIDQPMATKRTLVNKKTTSPVRTFNGRMKLNHNNCSLRQTVIPGLTAKYTQKKVQTGTKKVSYGGKIGKAFGLKKNVAVYSNVKVENPVVTKMIESYKKAGKDYSGLAEASDVSKYKGGTNDYYLGRHAGIRATCTGLKPNTRVYARFDGRDVTHYINSPGKRTLVTDGGGRLSFRFTIPNDSTMKFRGYKHLLEVSDVRPPVKNGISSGKDGATTRCGQYYFASTNKNGFSYKSRGKMSGIWLQELSADNTQTSVTTTQVKEELPDFMSQVFTIPATKIDGIYLSEIDLFFIKKPNDASAGVELQIRECGPAGPTEKLIDESDEILNANINLSSTTGHTATTFKFTKRPFLQSGKKYAFTVIPTEQGSDYELLSMVKGKKDFRSNKTAYAPTGIGKLYGSATGKKWAELKNETLKFQIKRADYNIGAASSFVLTNADTEFLNVNFVSPFGEPSATTGFQMDEKVRGQSLLTLGANTDSFAVGDILQSKIAKDETFDAHPTGYANGVVRKIVSTSPVILSIDAFGDFPTDANANNEQKVYRGTTELGTTSGFAANTVTGIVSFFNHDYGRLRLNESTGVVAGSGLGFRGGDNTRDWVRSQDSATSAFIQSVADVNLDSIELITPYFSPKNTKVEWGVKTTSTAGVTASSFLPVVGDNEIELSQYQKKIYSKSNRTAKSLIVKGTITSEDKRIAPIFTLNDISARVELQRINNSFGNEQFAAGDATARYVSKVVPASRPDGGAAERLTAVLNLYCPSESTVKVYVRAKNNNDSEELEDKVFTELVNYASVPKKNSALGDKNDVVKRLYRFPKSTNDNYLTIGDTADAGANAIKELLTTRKIKYRSGDDSTHSGIDRMQFKIVMTRPDGSGRDYTPEIKHMTTFTSKTPVS